MFVPQGGHSAEISVGFKGAIYENDPPFRLCKEEFTLCYLLYRNLLLNSCSLLLGDAVVFWCDFCFGWGLLHVTCCTRILSLYFRPLSVYFWLFGVVSLPLQEF